MMVRCTVSVKVGGVAGRKVILKSVLAHVMHKVKLSSVVNQPVVRILMVPCMNLVIHLIVTGLMT